MHGGTLTQRGNWQDRAMRRLTPRQLEVLALMAEGQNNTDIARSLAITERAVVGHTSQIYERLDLAADESGHRRVLAVVRYLHHVLPAA